MLSTSYKYMSQISTYIYETLCRLTSTKLIFQRRASSFAGAGSWCGQRMRKVIEIVKKTIIKARNILAELYKFDDAIRAAAPLEADAVAVCKDIKIFSQILTFSRCL